MPPFSGRTDSVSTLDSDYCRSLVEREDETIAGSEDERNSSLRFRQDEAFGTVFLSIALIVLFLNLKAGVSRNNLTLVLVMLRHLIVIILALLPMLEIFGFASAHDELNTARIENHPLLKQVPKDFRTVTRRMGMEPEIHRQPCCPKCFKPYTLDESKKYINCPYRLNNRVKPCDGKLVRIQHTPKGRKLVANSSFSTQSLVDWLETNFLQREGVEDLLDSSLSHERDEEVMRSIWDSPAWTDIKNNDGTPFTSKPGNLVFSYTIDWWNPHGNVISGKKKSIGSLSLICLSLPWSAQVELKNIFVKGISPGPNEPSVDSCGMDYIQKSLVDELLVLWSGKMMKTRRCPQGRYIGAIMIPLIADILAVHAAGGTPSHSAQKAGFCHFDFLELSRLHDLNIDDWPRRSNADHSHWAREWRDAVTKKQRNEIFKEHGVRWSELNRLPYRDSIHHTVIGVMHCMCIGVFGTHQRAYWGFEVPKGQTMRVLADAPDPDDDGDDFIDDIPFEEVLGTVSRGVDINQNMVELSKTWESVRPPTRSVRAGEVFPSDDIWDDHNNSDEDSDYDPDTPSSTSSSISTADSEEEVLEAPPFASKECRDEVNSAISEVYAPTWLERPPANLGEASHGKLKAEVQHLLFCVFLPLVLVEIWSTVADNSDPKWPCARLLLENFIDLVTAGNIALAFSTTKNASIQFLEVYTRYRRSSQRLFRRWAKERPNHHYAMHIAEQLQFWGPLRLLSEFSGERLIGILRKAQTNNKIYELDFSVLSFWMRLNSFLSLPLRIPIPSFISRHFDLWKKPVSLDKKTRACEPLNSAMTMAEFERATEALPEGVYTTLAAKLNSSKAASTRFIRKDEDLRGIRQERVLSSFHQYQPSWTDPFAARTYSCRDVHRGNSGIIFKTDDGEHKWGEIFELFKHARHEDNQWLLETFALVGEYSELDGNDISLDPFRANPGLNCKLFYNSHRASHLISVADIVVHHAHRERPSGTFGIKKKTIAAVDLDFGKSA